MNILYPEKGFTLIELLAVIVILAIIALIATPIILNIIDDAKKGAFEASSYNIVSSAEKGYVLKHLAGEVPTITEYKYENGNYLKIQGNVEINYSGESPTTGTLLINNKGEVAIAFYKNGWCSTKKYDSNIIIIDKRIENKCEIPEEIPLSEYKDITLNGADPVLDEGMIAVIIDNNGTVKKADTYSSWYDYNNKKWANVVLVTSAARDTYKNAMINSVIAEDDILAYYTWIPRYEYETITSPTATEIKINFISKTVKTPSLNHIIHPAFTLGDEELEGIWVGKFETTGTSTLPTIKPNITSLRNQNVSNQFKTSLAFGNRIINNDGTITENPDKTTYGLISESRMMKNIEWGAAAYLAHSQYGINSELRINNNSGYITGCGALIVNGNGTANCEIRYGQSDDYPQSTTGNITGIFDMSGGAWEWVMGAMKDLSGNLYTGYNTTYNSGFNGKYTQGGSLTTGINFPSSKYFDSYEYGTSVSDYTRAINGDATKEINGWYTNYAVFIYSGDTWFSRGGLYNFGKNAGIFTFHGYSGYAGHFSFRTVVSLSK